MHFIRDNMFSAIRKCHTQVAFLCPSIHRFVYVYRNFVAGILQFQIYRALCQAAGQRFPEDPRKPLHKCDFYRSPEAGRLLG